MGHTVILVPYQRWSRWFSRTSVDRFPGDVVYALSDSEVDTVSKRLPVTTRA